jgi:hypothetical protein
MGLLIIALLEHSIHLLSIMIMKLWKMGEAYIQDVVSPDMSKA